MSSDDGRPLLASAGDDTTVRLWDPGTGAAIVALLRRTTLRALTGRGTQLVIADEEGIAVVEIMDGAGWIDPRAQGVAVPMQRLIAFPCPHTSRLTYPQPNGRNEGCRFRPLIGYDRASGGSADQAQNNQICMPQSATPGGKGLYQIGGYLRGCDGSSVTFRDELGASIHPQGGGMTHSGVMAVELVRSTRLFAGARMLTPPGLASLIFTPGACLSMTRAGHCPG